MWDDRIEIKDLLVKPNYDKNQYNITIQYLIKSFTEIQTFETTLYAL
jgi:hypothetical protein